MLYLGNNCKFVLNFCKIALVFFQLIYLIELLNGNNISKSILYPFIVLNATEY